MPRILAALIAALAVTLSSTVAGAQQWQTIPNPVASICSDTNTMDQYFRNEDARLARCSGKPNNFHVEKKQARITRSGACIPFVSCVQGGINRPAEVCYIVQSNLKLANVFCMARNGGSDLEGCYLNHQCATGFSHYEFASASRNPANDEIKVCVNLVDDSDRSRCRFPGSIGSSCEDLVGEVWFAVVDKNIAENCP